jgi:hypothetical protein
MKNYLKELGKRIGKFATGLALATSLIMPMPGKAMDGIELKGDYSRKGWNIETIYYQEDHSPITNKTSTLNLVANNLQVNINTFKFYSAGNSKNKLYIFNGKKYIPITNIKINNNYGIPWAVQSITNLGKYPRIFGITNDLVFVDEEFTDTQTNKTIRTDEHVRVFDRDIYETTFSTTDSVAYANFNLDLDLITDENNTTNDNETAVFGPLYGKYESPTITNYYGYLNRVFGVMGRPLNISTNDTNTNGIPDSFEATYSSSPTNLVAEADEDGDGANNLKEYLNGTNPQDNSSVLKIKSLENKANSIDLSWQGSLTNFFYKPLEFTIRKATNLESLASNDCEAIYSATNSFTYSDTNLNQRAFYVIECDKPIELPTPPTP